MQWRWAQGRVQEPVHETVRRCVHRNAYISEQRRVWEHAYRGTHGFVIVRSGWVVPQLLVADMGVSAEPGHGPIYL